MAHCRNVIINFFMNGSKKAAICGIFNTERKPPHEKYILIIANGCPHGSF